MVSKGLGLAIADIVKYTLQFVGVLALALLVYGGFKYITAGGDEQALGAAKETMTKAVIGVAIIGLAYAIVLFTYQALTT